MGRRFDVRPPRLRSASDECCRQSGEANRIAYEVQEIEKRLKGMSDMDEVCRRLRRISDDITHEASLLSGYAQAALEISSIYDKSEENIRANACRELRKYPVRRVAGWDIARPAVNPIWLRILK